MFVAGGFIAGGIPCVCSWWALIVFVAGGFRLCL